jgi:putative NADPH-quinone reductase
MTLDGRNASHRSGASRAVVVHRQLGTCQRRGREGRRGQGTLVRPARHGLSIRSRGHATTPRMTLSTRSRPMRRLRRRKLPPDAAAEAEKITAADVIIFHFPLWWFGPPAILKGWLDRCLIHGALHDVEHRFDAGPPDGQARTVLRQHRRDRGGMRTRRQGRGRASSPLAFGLHLRYCGMDVCEPVLIHGVHGYFDGAEETALEARLSEALVDQGTSDPRSRTTPDAAVQCGH